MNPIERQKAHRAAVAAGKYNTAPEPAPVVEEVEEVEEVEVVEEEDKPRTFWGG